MFELKQLSKLNKTAINDMEYMKHMVTVNQISARDTWKIKRIESKHNTTESDQHPREESKRNQQAAEENKTHYRTKIRITTGF